MRYLMLIYPSEKAEAGAMPDAKLVEKMMKYNEDLAKAGVLLALDGLHPPSMGARVSFSNGKPSIKDGPFAEAKEVLGGFNIIEARDMDEAVKIALAFPWAATGCVEVRPIRDVAGVRQAVGG